MQVIFSAHAEGTLKIRGISKEFVLRTVAKPDDIICPRLNREIRQKDFGKAILRVIGVVEGNAFVVITQYWFSKSKIK